MEKKYNIYFTIKNEKGIARPVVMRGWYESPIEAIKAAKHRNATNGRKYCCYSLHS